MKFFTKWLNFIDKSLLTFLTKDNHFYFVMESVLMYMISDNEYPTTIEPGCCKMYED